MTAARALQRRVSAAEYLAAERAATEKHEFFDGIVVPWGGAADLQGMAGGSYLHFRLASRVLQALARALDGRGCEVGGSDLKVKNAAVNSYVYPDVVVICGEPRFDDEQLDVLLNPTSVVEVLSPSTEAHDRGKKSQVYRAIPSLQTYVLVAQDEPRIEWFERAGEFWVLHEALGLDAVAALESLAVTLPLAEVYAGISFAAEPGEGSVEPG